MEEKISKSKYIAITAILCFTLIVNLLSWQNQSIGLAFGLLYVVFYSFILGSIFVTKKGWQFILGFTFLLSLIAIIGALFIYFAKFNDYAYILTLLIIPALLSTPYYNTYIRKKFSLKESLKKYLAKFTERKEPKVNSTLVAIYLTLITGGFYMLALARVDHSIQSPWQILPFSFFLLYFLATCTLITYLLNSTRTKLPLILIVIHTFFSSAIALILYKVGYGFDPFIHQAAENIISQVGTITPKTPYYLGQYGIVIFLQKLTLLSIGTIDKVLVPALFSLLFPTTIFYVFSYWLEKNHALVLSLASLVIPFSGFIMTTPQNLANLFFVITILLSLLYFRNQMQPQALYLLALATIVIHPLAGIPLVITIVLFNLFKVMYKSYYEYISLYFLAALVFTIFLPLAFIVNGSEILSVLPDIKKTDFNFLGWINNYHLSGNMVYLLNINKIILATLVVLTGLYSIAKNKLLKNNAAYLIAALVIYIDYLITKYFLTFPELRNFDSTDFVNRLFTLSSYILLPFFLLGMHVIIKKFWSKDYFFQSALVLTLGFIISSSMYLSYPRLDNYEPSKFYSLSQSDIRAVNYIEQSAVPDHIVLANQMVGVAAIKEFGFKKYYNGQFYYSMPNGSSKTFYDGYLSMIYEGAKKETMEKVMVEAGVTESYFVLNKYWRNFEKIYQQASVEADEIITIDNGEVIVFQYNLN